MTEEHFGLRPLVYRPSWTKDKLWSEAVDYINHAELAWGITPKAVIARVGPPNPKNKFQDYGLWIPPNRIHVNVKKSTSPPRTRGRIWSYPGSKSDRTCAGILAHEYAHHVAGHKKMDAVIWREIVRLTKPVTGYEPNTDEAWAESMRIFILNPRLLAMGRPLRYEFITKYFKPLHNEPWDGVLRNAPDFIIAAARKFCNEGKQSRKRTARLI